MDLSSEECSGRVSAPTFSGAVSAVKYATSIGFYPLARYGGEGSWSWNPKGCYIHDSGTMYFNTHSTGGVPSIFTSICSKGNTYFYVHY